MATPKDLKKDFEDIDLALRGISSQIEDNLKNSLKTLEGPAKILLKSLGQDLKNAIDTSNKSLNEQDKIINKINKGQNASRNLAKEIEKIEQQRSVIQRKIETLQRAGNLLTEEQKTLLLSLSEAQLDILNRLKDQNDEMVNSTGLVGRLAGGFGDVLDKLGASKEVSSLLTNALEDARAGGGGLGAVVKNFTSNLIQAVKPTDIIALLLKQTYEALKAIDQSTGELAKNMGISYEESLGMASSMTDIANKSGETYVTTQNLVKSQMALSKAFGTNVLLSGELLKDYTQITEQAGYSAEAATSLGKITQSTGGDLSKNTAAILGTAAAFNATNKLALNEKEIVEEVAKTGAATVLTFGKSAKALANNVLEAKKFGLNLEQASRISEGLLNFQSSIESELEAELLTGKQLNFEQARFLALQGKTGEAAAEIAKQIGTSADFANMTVVSQEALAKSVGISRDELAQSILDREVLAKLGAKEGTAQEAYNKLKEQGLSDDAIAAKLGDEKLATQLKSQSVQERFNASVAKMQDLFIGVAEPILAIVSPLMDLAMVVLPLINILLQPIKTTFDGISKIISGDLDKLSLWEGTLGGIAIVLGGILGLNKAISVIEGRVTLAKELQFGLGAKILAGLGLQNMALNYQIAREQGMNVLRAIGVTLEQTKLSSIIAQTAATVVNMGKLIAENALRLIGAAASMATASASTLGVGIAAVIAGIIAGMAALKSAQKADDLMSPGYGKRTLTAPEGTYALNDKDTIIAGTNLGGGGEKTTSPTTSPSIDLSPLLVKMDQMNNILNQLLSKEGTVTLDGTKVGTALTMGSYKLQ